MNGSVFETLRSKTWSPGRPFLEVPGGLSLTYGELFSLSARYANVLRALGVTKGNRVAAQVEKTPAALMVYLACARLGAIYVPLNTAYTPTEIAYFLQDAEPALFLCDPHHLDTLTPIARDAGVRTVETLDAAGGGSLAERAAQASSDFADAAVEGDDLAAILYTSGTTGRSKGAMLTHDNLVSNARSLVAAWEMTSADILLHALPIFHTHGLFVAVNTVLLSGASMIFMSRFDPDMIMAAMARATMMMGVPTFYSRLLSQPQFGEREAKHMRLFISGSAPLPAEVHRAFRQRTGHAILERYGMTETNMNSSNPLRGERRPGTVGFPLPGIELRIADPESGRPLANGAVGVIEVRGPNVFKGYWRSPEKTKTEFRDDGFFITGDLARVDDDGYVVIVGRAKDLIISGGFNVYPAEVEAALDALEGVADSAVIGVPHADFGEGVTAIVTARPGASPDERAMRDALSNTLAKYKVPKRIIVVEALPRNAMGKVQKNVLRETFKDLYAG